MRAWPLLKRELQSEYVGISHQCLMGSAPVTSKNSFFTSLSFDGLRLSRGSKMPWVWLPSAKVKLVATGGAQGFLVRVLEICRFSPGKREWPWAVADWAGVLVAYLSQGFNKPKGRGVPSILPTSPNSVVSPNFLFCLGLPCNCKATLTDSHSALHIMAGEVALWQRLPPTLISIKDIPDKSVQQI